MTSHSRCVCPHKPFVGVNSRRRDRVLPMRNAAGRLHSIAFARRGVTLAEALVSIAVIGLLAAILIPAVMSARESSRRTECKTRLASLGTAMHAFESGHQEFPPTIPRDGVNVTPYSARTLSPHVFMLPHLDQGPLAEKIDTGSRHFYRFDPREGPDAEAAMTKVPAFLCPSDPVDFGNNYRASIGPFPYPYDNHLSPHGDGGAFSPLYPRRAADFDDGLSNTIAMSEKLKSDADAGSWSEQDLWFSGARELLGEAPPREELIRICGALSGPPPEYHPFTGHTWFYSGFEFTWYNHSLGPNAEVPDCTVSSYSSTHQTGGGVSTADSAHTGGVNCLFMDGAVKFVSDSVDLEVWRALATRDGGETIGQASY